jgi:hypothetical protein
LVVIWLVFSLFIRPLPPANNILAAVFVAAAAAMGIYLAFKKQYLSDNERWGIILSIPVWLLLAYSIYR